MPPAPIPPEPGSSSGKSRQKWPLSREPGDEMGLGGAWVRPCWPREDDPATRTLSRERLQGEELARPCTRGGERGRGASGLGHV